MTEPDVTLTDYGLFVECAAFAWVTARRPSDPGALRRWTTARCSPLPVWAETLYYRQVLSTRRLLGGRTLRRGLYGFKSKVPLGCRRRGAGRSHNRFVAGQSQRLGDDAIYRN
jgi:hypothetical protein